MSVRYTDEQLKRALAKMLPCHVSIMRGYLRWNEGEQIRVLDTELLHLCSLVEETLSSYDGEHGEELSQKEDYSRELMKQCGTWKSKDWNWEDVCNADLFQAANAPWQTRVIAAAKVKGVEIV